MGPGTHLHRICFKGRHLGIQPLADIHVPVRLEPGPCTLKAPFRAGGHLETQYLPDALAGPRPARGSHGLVVIW